VASSNELHRRRYTREEFLEDELNEKLQQLHVYDKEHMDAKEQWEQAQLKLFEEIEQLEQQALEASYVEHLKYMKLMEEKANQKQQ
jgi:hypothetical protein